MIALFFLIPSAVIAAVGIAAMRKTKKRHEIWFAEWKKRNPHTPC